uniref:SUN domain-containing protein n=1 Tax=Ditylenchus dipsaci TaxID=166011 RepID=A0A915EBY9_9BILA
MSSAFESVRKRLSFSPSPSPSSASLTSRLSQEEIDEILTSPYETGYTYSSSAAYKRTSGSTEFRHPQLCRRLKLAPPQYNSQTNQYDYYTFEDELKSSYASTKNFNMLEKLFYKVCHSIQVLIVFSITCLIFVWKTSWTALKYTGKWLLKYFVIIPLFAPYYAALQYYYKAKYAYAASVYVYPSVKQWLTWFWDKYIVSKTTTTTTSIVTEVDTDENEGNPPSYDQSTSIKQPKMRKALSGSYKAYKNSPFKSIFWTILWVLTMGLVGASGASGTERRETDSTSGGPNLRTRSQLKGILKQSQQQESSLQHTWNKRSGYVQQFTQDETQISFSKILSGLLYVVFTPFRWIYNLVSWLSTSIKDLVSWLGGGIKQLAGWIYTNLMWIYWGGVPKAIYSYCFTRSVDSSQVVSHKQVFKTRSLQGEEMVKENKESATILYIRLAEMVVNWPATTFLLWFLFYPLMNPQSTEVPSHSALASLHHEIDMLKQDLRQLSLKQSESTQSHNHIHQAAPSSGASEIDGLDAKIAEILNQLMTSEQDITNQEAEQNQQAHMDEIEREVDKKIANFMSSISAQVNDQNSKLFQELEQLRESYIKLSAEKSAAATTTNKETKSTTLILERQTELDESLYYSKVRQLIKESIQRYDADKTGLPDYALESSGGAVASIRCTVPYNERSRTQMIFGIPLWYSSYSPRSVIQRKGYGASAGECWAFVGPHGYLTIRLSQKINVTAVSYEHLPVQLSPDGHIQTAPKDFLIYSYQDVDDLDSRFLLGNFTYNDKGEPLQMFQMQHYDPRMTPVIEFETTSNYGAMVTCLYRFRVHGALPKKTN